jgi:TetR/AcrR family transcriptional regulator, cholesterol catabolism regulator
MTRSLQPASKKAPRKRAPPAARPAADEGPRGRLLRAAAHLFLTRGYADTTVREIARAVGILSGSIFHHFDSKEAILEAVMTDVSARNAERMRSAAAAEKAPRGKVRALIRCELESIHGDSGEAMTLLVTEWRSLGAEAKGRTLAHRDRYEAVWLEAIEGARAELTKMDPFIMRRMIFGMTAATSHWYRPHGPLSLDGLTEQIMALILRKRGEP